MIKQLRSHPAYRLHRRVLGWLLLAAAIVCAIIGWRMLTEKPKDTHNKNAATVITVTSAKNTDLPVYLHGLGTVQAFNTVTVRTRIDGELLTLPFREGQLVNAGDVLATLDDRTLAAQYHQALANKAKSEAELANARVDLKRYKNLSDSISQQVVDTQQATVRQLEATVMGDEAAAQNAKAALSYATITSPITGRTGIRQVDVGNIIHTGDSNGIVTITQIEPISVLFSLPQQNLEAINAQLNKNRPLIVQAMASDDKTVIDTGVLELVDNQIDSSTGAILLKSTFPNSSHALWPGGFTNVRLLLSTTTDAVVIPTVAIQQGPQGAYVFVYRKDTAGEAPKDNQPPNGTGQAILTPVTVGIQVDDTSEILHGLAAGDVVITDGMAKLQNKKRVKLIDESHKDEKKPPASHKKALPPEPRSGE